VLFIGPVGGEFNNKNSWKIQSCDLLQYVHLIYLQLIHINSFSETVWKISSRLEVYLCRHPDGRTDAHLSLSSCLFFITPSPHTWRERRACWGTTGSYCCDRSLYQNPELFCQESVLNIVANHTLSPWARATAYIHSSQQNLFTNLKTMLPYRRSHLSDYHSAMVLCKSLFLSLGVLQIRYYWKT